VRSFSGQQFRAELAFDQCTLRGSPDGDLPSIGTNPTDEPITPACSAVHGCDCGWPAAIIFYFAQQGNAPALSVRAYIPPPPELRSGHRALTTGRWLSRRTAKTPVSPLTTGNLQQLRQRHRASMRG
jgi:hypothetical protein